MSRQTVSDLLATLQVGDAPDPEPCGRVAGLPTRFADADVAALRAGFGRAEMVLLDDAVRWVDAPSGTLFLEGPVGFGKTTLAAALLRRYVAARPVDAHFASTVKVLNPYATGEADFTLLERASLLVLDDLLYLVDGDLSARELSRLYRLLNERWANRRPTIVTMNADRAELERRLAPSPPGDRRIIERLCDDCIELQLVGASRRTAK